MKFRNMGLKSILELVMLLYRYILKFGGNVNRVLNRCHLNTEMEKSLLLQGYEHLTYTYREDQKNMIFYGLEDTKQGRGDIRVALNEDREYLVMRRGRVSEIHSVKNIDRQCTNQILNKS